MAKRNGYKKPSRQKRDRNGKFVNKAGINKSNGSNAYNLKRGGTNGAKAGVRNPSAKKRVRPKGAAKKTVNGRSSAGRQALVAGVVVAAAAGSIYAAHKGVKGAGIDIGSSNRNGVRAQGVSVFTRNSLGQKRTHAKLIHARADGRSSIIYSGGGKVGAKILGRSSKAGSTNSGRIPKPKPAPRGNPGTVKRAVSRTPASARSVKLQNNLHTISGRQRAQIGKTIGANIRRQSQVKSESRAWAQNLRRKMV